MTNLPWKPDDLWAVSPEAVRDYLARRGWVPSSRPHPTLTRFENRGRLMKDGNPLYYYFPPEADTVDYPLSVMSFLRAMSSLYDTTQDIVFRELTGRLPSWLIPAPMPAS